MAGQRNSLYNLKIPTVHHLFVGEVALKLKEMKTAIQRRKFALIIQ